MKQYRQFLREMPTKTIVFAFGRFQCPTQGHELLVNVVKKLATSNKADHIIYASRTQDKKKNPLPVDKKVHYLNLMFPHTNFKAANDKERTFIEAVKALNSKYKNLIMVAGSDRVPDYEKLLNKYNGIDYNYDTIQVISAGERDPDAEDASGMSGTKMRALAVDNDYTGFKKGLPKTMKDVDGKLLMNDVRQGLGLEVIKEQLKFETDALREQYHNKEIFNIGDTVVSNDTLFEIVNRGSNYLTLIDIKGITTRKWIQEVTMSDQKLFTNAQFIDRGIQDSKEISFKGYTSKNLHNAEGAACAFQKTINNMAAVDPISILNALKFTDEYLKMTPAIILKGGEEHEDDIHKWENNHLMAKRALDKMGEFINHVEYWHIYKDLLDKAVFSVKIKSTHAPMSGTSLIGEDMLDKNKDKLKVAKVIASILGVEDIDKSSNPENLVNQALRKTKSLNKDSLKIVTKMLKLADEVGIKYDSKLVKTPSGVTNEQFEQASNRAERYGRRYPNPIDTAWALSEAKVQSIVVDKSHTNLSALRPDDEAKLDKMNKLGKGKTPKGIDPKDAKEISNYAETGHSDGSTSKHGVGQAEITHVGASLAPGNDTLARMKAKKLMGEEKEIDDIDDISDKEIDDLIAKLVDDDYLDAYEEHELAIIDAESGEEVEDSGKLKEDVLCEVLSKMERIKSRLRFHKNQPKIQRARMIALKRHSGSKQINNRARHMAVSLIRKKLLRGQNPSSASTTQKERIDRIIEKKKKIIDRMAMKLAPRVRANEKNRLSHSKFTKH